MSSKTYTFQLWTYDLWADGEGGRYVNDRYSSGQLTLTVKGTVNNPGTPHAFESFEPTDRQLNRLVGGRGLHWEGEAKYTLYATDKNGDPVCELECLDVK